MTSAVLTLLLGQLHDLLLDSPSLFLLSPLSLLVPHRNISIGGHLNLLYLGFVPFTLSY